MATLPAYESDLFGPRHVGAIHSRSQKSPIHQQVSKVTIKTLFFIATVADVIIATNIFICTKPRFLLSTTVAALAGPALLLNLRSVIERESHVFVVVVVVVVIGVVIVVVVVVVFV